MLIIIESNKGNGWFYEGEAADDIEAMRMVYLLQCKGIAARIIKYHGC